MPVIYLLFWSPKISIDLPTERTSRPFLFRVFGLFDLSAHEVYLALAITCQPVGSYPTISPLPLFPRKDSKAVFFLLHLLLQVLRCTFQLGSMVALRCPDFPLDCSSDKLTYFLCKIRLIFSQFHQFLNLVFPLF